MTHTYKLCIEIEVHDEQQLLKAAQKHPDSKDADLVTREVGDDEDCIDVEACLITLLDPGHLAGCSIIESYVEGLS